MEFFLINSGNKDNIFGTCLCLESHKYALLYLL